MGVCDSGNNDQNNLVDNLDSQIINEMDRNKIQVSPWLCRIKTKTLNGTGFLIKLIKNNEDLFCLMTSQHLITREMIESKENKENIEISYDCDQKHLLINLNKFERLIKDFIDINIDITIVQILPKDQVKEQFFLLPYIIDSDLSSLIDKTIYIPELTTGDNLNFSTGIIKGINNDEFNHNINTKSGTSGSPIFLENSIKVIGMHKQGNITINDNYGYFIYPIIQSLQTNIINELNGNENDLVNNKKEIYGKYNHKYDGDYYIGPLLNGLPNGKGKIYNKNGNIFYDGEFVNGEREGNGKEFYEDGEYYTGQYKDNMKNGQGEYYFKSGNYCIGQYLNNLRHGKIKYYYKNGDIYEGDYINDKREGYGKYIRKDGNSNTGYWLKDSWHGKGKQFIKTE